MRVKAAAARPEARRQAARAYDGGYGKHAVSASFRAAGRGENLVFLVLCAAPLILSAFMTTDGVQTTLHLFGIALPFGGECYFRLLTGYRCPACGMTRCFVYLSHGNFFSAWHMSHPGVAVYALCLYEPPYRAAKLISKRFSRLWGFRAAEVCLIVAASAAVVFFFAAQFVYPAIAA